jgi:mono/diheme cytochrome c family protein
MKLSLTFSCALLAAVIFTAESAFSDPVLNSSPVSVPDMSHESDHLADTVMAWDATMKTTNVPADTEKAHLVFYFTNVATRAGVPIPVTVLDAEPSCHCTTPELPPLPWVLPPGTNGQIAVTVDITGKYGTVVKSVRIGTDQGSRELIIQVNILPDKISEPSDAERARQMQMAKVDRQAVFKNDCASCHMKPGEDKYGKALYEDDCGICHESEHRASMVPDLHTLKVPTNNAFWRTWIAHGKPGTLMPAFSEADGGPLDDMQIATLAAYLTATIPSRGPSSAVKN